MSPTRYRVASSHPEETAKGATFAPGEEVRGLDPENEDDARKIDEGRFVEIAEQAPPKISDAAANKAAELGVDLEKVEGTGANNAITVADVQRTHDNQEGSE
jgi:pyruvate/2-oxoglutarate dehydrogenase complex dihydrolipoamide acyltransferase (E2) component